MRARLLDLGEVGPVRSQSAYHAVLAGIAAGDDPVVLLVRPSSALVSIGEQVPGKGDHEEAVDVQACLESGIPLVRRRVGGPTVVLGEHDLLIQLVIPDEKIPTKAVSSAASPVLQTLAELGVAARDSGHGGIETEGGRIGHLQAAVVNSALCVAYCLHWNQPASGPVPGRLSTSLAAEMERQGEAPTGLAELAERLLTAIEGHFSLDLFPSLPTPAELEAIYEWDRRLPIETLEEASITETVTAVLQ